MSLLVEKALVLALSAAICLSVIAILVEQIIPLVSEFLSQYGNETLPLVTLAQLPFRTG